MTPCPMCDTELRDPEGPGRPPRYCSETCRRTAEVERTRLRSLIGTVDRRRIAAVEKLALVPNSEARANVLRVLEEELDRARARLAELMLEPTPETRR